MSVGRELPNSDPSPLGSTLEEARERRRQNPEYVNAEKRNDILERLRSREPFPGRLDAAIAEIERLQSENERLRSAEQSEGAVPMDLEDRVADYLLSVNRDDIRIGNAAATVIKMVTEALKHG